MKCVQNTTDQLDVNRILDIDRLTYPSYIIAVKKFLTEQVDKKIPHIVDTIIDFKPNHRVLKHLLYEKVDAFDAIVARILADKLSELDKNLLAAKKWAIEHMSVFITDPNMDPKRWEKVR